MNIELYNEDCLDTLSRMADDSVDVVITSPPYNMNLRIRNGKYCSRQIVEEFSTKYRGFNDNLPMEEYFEFHKKVLNELLRVSPLVFYNIQMVTGNKLALFKLIGEFSSYLKEVIIWDKVNAQPAMGKGILNSQFEFVLVFDKYNAISRKFNNANFDRGTLSNVWNIKPNRRRRGVNYHGATFPEELVRKILKFFCKESGTVYDPFMGTGTTGVVCMELGYDFIGSELIHDYFLISKENLYKNETI